MARLSSGNRINSASDDAAGVAIASRLTADIRGTDQAIRNALDGQALLDTAEGAHKEIENILQRMREVSVQAANDTNNQQDRDNLQAELNALSNEIDRIAGTTTWAGTGLLNGDGTGGPGTATDFSFQVGANTSEADRISVQIEAMSTEALGFGSTAAVAAVPQIGGDVQPVTIASGTNSTASGSVFSLDSNTVTSGGEAQAVTIAAGNQTTAAGSIITLDAGTTTISTDTVTHVATTTAITGATATDPETTVTTTTTKVHTRTGGTAADPTIAGGNQTTTTGNIISLDLNTPTEFTPTKAGAEFQLSTFTNGHQASSSVTMLSDGGFVATWFSEGQDDTVGTYTYHTRGIFGQRFDASGNPVGSEFQINTHVSNQQAYPAITSLPNDGFVVVWHSAGQEFYHGIYGQRYNSSGVAVGTEFHVNTYTSNYQVEADITTLSDGSFVVTWTSKNQDGSSYGIYGQRFDADGFKLSDEFQINTETYSSQYYPNISSLEDGGFVVTWQSAYQDGSDYGIYGQRYDQYGNTVGFEFSINTETNDEQQFPSISSIADGGFVATWASYGQDGSEYGVYGQRFDASGAPAGSEFQVNTYTNSNQANPSITALPDGGYLIVWNSYGQDGQTSGVYGQRYDAVGSAIGSEFQVNTGDGNSPSYSSYTWWDEPSISADPDGNVVVTWAANNQEDSGSGYGVFGQRFDAAYETPLASNASVVVNGKTLTIDLSSHHNGSVNDHYGAAAAIASAINNDSDLQTAGYHATVATVDQVNAGTHAAGDVVITRAHILDETVTTDTTSATTTVGAVLDMTPTKLGPEFQVNTYTSGAQGDPAITNLSNGGFVVTWTNESNQDGSGYGVFGQMYDASGNTVGAEFQVNTYTSNNQRHPDISGLSDGGFVVTWHSRHQDGDDQGIFGQKFDASGNKAGSEFQVNTHTTSFQQYSAVTSLTDGGFVVTWHDDSGHDGSADGVFGQKYTNSGNASGSQFQINSTTASAQAYPSITSLTDGGFVASWTDYSGEDGSEKGIFGQWYDASGNTVASEFQINTQTSGDQSWSDIKSLPNGGFVVTWTGQDASGNGIFAQRYSASGEKDGSEFRVNTYQNGNEMHAEVTALTDGGYVVIWYSDTHTDDTYYGVHGQRFDASGAAVGSQFLVNTDISNAQQYPEIAPLADSGFAVTWQSYLQDGSHYGIYAQRFASPSPSGTTTTTDHTVSTITGSTTGEAPFGSDVSFGVGGKTLTLDLSTHHDGSNNDYYGAAEAIATAINGDSDLQALGYSAAAATLAEVNAGTYAAGDIIITRADTPITTTNTLVGNAASFIVEGITVNTDLSAYSEDLSGAAAAVASDINADAALQALDYNATADASNPGDIIISRANTPITQAYVAAAPATTAMSLASGDTARAAVAKIDAAITTVNVQRSELGAVSNRLSHTVNNLTNISANLSAARGGIEDADFALETTQLAKLQILNQAATAMLAQANASKQNILRLLQQ